jgi:hypothetical protein
MTPQLEQPECAKSTTFVYAKWAILLQEKSPRKDWAYFVGKIVYKCIIAFFTKAYKHSWRRKFSKRGLVAAIFGPGKGHMSKRMTLICTKCCQNNNLSRFFMLSQKLIWSILLIHQANTKTGRKHQIDGTEGLF